MSKTEQLAKHLLVMAIAVAMIIIWPHTPSIKSFDFWREVFVLSWVINLTNTVDLQS